MRIYHTLWTAPMTSEKVRVTMTCFALSLEFAKRLGAQVVLHTDKLGYLMLSDLDYDEIYIDLEKLPKELKHFWAFGKLYATAKEPLGSIHIDGDVFLKDPKLVDMISNDYDLLVQSEEGVEWRVDDTYEMSRRAISQAPLLEGYDINYPTAYNCGITQFLNKDLKDKYIKMYNDSVKSILSDPSYPERYKTVAEDKSLKGTIIPDIIIEQQCLHQLAVDEGSKVKCLLTGDIFKCADEIGYSHIISGNKFLKFGEMKDLLSDLNPKVYSKLINNPVWISNPNTLKVKAE